MLAGATIGWRCFGAAAIAVLLLIGAGTPLRAESIELRTTRISLRPSEPGQNRLGAYLLYRGGIVLTSSDPRFGGLSGLLISRDGRTLLAVEDESRWVMLKLDYQRGDLAGAHDAEIWPMLDLAGQPIHSKEGDAESLAALSSHGLHGDVAVGFERHARIWRYRFGRDGPQAVPTTIPAPPEAAAVRSNRGLEALAALRDGRLLALTEATLDASGNMMGWLLSGESFAPISFKRRNEFNLSDATALPSGGIITLERRFNMLQGVFVRLRYVPQAEIRRGAVLDGTVLAGMGPGFAIDNMEGVSVRGGRDGDTLLYIVADDNFNRLERTILLMFELKTDRLPQPRPR